MASRQFSIPTVLRMVPNDLLSDVFNRLGHGGLGIAWRELKEREVEPVVKAISLLPRREQSKIESVLRSIFELACETGIDAIFEAALRCGDLDLPRSMPRDTGPYAKAAWAWLHRIEAFEKATLFHQVENLAWWRKRRDLPQVRPDTSHSALKRLGEAISDFLLLSQGRGQACTVEHFSRSDGTDYFFAHADDFVENITSHDDEGTLSPKVLKQTFVMVFAFNADEGSLELFARVPGKLKVEIEKIFCGSILRQPLGDWCPEAAYELDQLKDPSFILATDPEDQLRVWVRRLRLSFRTNGRRILLEVPSGDDSMHEMMAQCLCSENVSMDDVHVTLATLTFEFLAQEGRKPGTLTFDVAWPHYCSLRNQRPERVEIAQKYLKRWKMDVGRSLSFDLETAGE